MKNNGRMSFLGADAYALTKSSVRGMVAYLVSPEAAMVTGAQHTIDGGFGA